MQKSFTTRSQLLVSASYMNHPTLRGLDSTEALLDWPRIESLSSSIYSSKTGCPSYPLWTLFRILLLGINYRM